MRPDPHRTGLGGKPLYCPGTNHARAGGSDRFREARPGAIRLWATDSLAVPGGVRHGRPGGVPSPGRWSLVAPSRGAQAGTAEKGKLGPGTALRPGHLPRRDVGGGDPERGALLRQATAAAGSRIRQGTQGGNQADRYPAARADQLRHRTPPANYSKKCESCSLLSVCLPRVTDRKRSVADYLQEAVS